MDLLEEGNEVVLAESMEFVRTFLHPQGRPCGRPPAAAVLGRQRHDDHWGNRPHPGNLGNIAGHAASIASY
jgi:hypothetical protein